MAIQIRRGNDAEWESNKSNIVAGEPAVAMDSERMFVGTGSGTYMELANLDVLADAFDSSASYEVGDFVAYHGKVYKFNTDHSGAWNASDVEEVALADALDSLGEDVYTKDEADALLNGKADKSTTYTKTEVDSALALKANTADVNSALALKADKSDTYTKAAVDASLALKADKIDTYTKTEVDNALALKADADDVYTKTEADTLLNKKANIDGYYEDMTVGNAEQLVTNLTDTESEPFTFRTSGGNLEIGDREQLEVVGGSVAWNQLEKVPESVVGAGITFSKDVNGIVSLTGTATETWANLFGSTYLYVGHVYLINNKIIANPNSLSINIGNLNAYALKSYDTTRIAKLNSAPSYAAGWGVQSMTVGSDYTGVKFITSAFDLTQMFGSTIADYIYNLEQTTVGAGVAFFKKYFPKDYYPYNAGEFLHVQTSEFKTVGFNQWDEEYTLTGIVANTGAVGTWTDRITSKNYIPAFSNMEYYLQTGKSTTVPFYIHCYDANKNWLGVAITANGYGYVGGKGLFTTKNGTAFIKFACGSNAYGTTYNHDICINLHWDGTRDGEYEPYTEHSYPLDDSLTLRGIPKLDADNNLYYNGDTYEHDGTVTRRYGVVDLGTLDWNLTTETDTYNSYFYMSLSDAKLPSGWGVVPNIICSRYIPATADDIALKSHQLQKGIGIAPNGRLIILDNNYSDVVTFKTAMSGVYLVYELATPTTETAEPYQSPQIVDNWGTEEFVVPTQSGVEIPVGHETVYPISLRDKLESAPNLPDGDGDYLLHMASGEASYKQLVSEFPSAPTTDGTYVLKATVSSGTATLTWVAE